MYSNIVTTVSPTYAHEALIGGAAGWLRSTLTRPDITAKFHVSQPGMLRIAYAGSRYAPGGVFLTGLHARHCLFFTWPAKCHVDLVNLQSTRMCVMRALIYAAGREC